MVSHKSLRKKFNSYWQSKGHKHVDPAPLVLNDDKTTLFTSSGMQPLVEYLSGKKHPKGNKLYNIQPCFRAVDINEVGDNRHTTFFEMMGNWSLGDYFKKEQLEWMWKFFTEELNLAKHKLYVTVFEGEHGIGPDDESYAIWKKLGVSKDRIFFYGADKNWWSRTGTPDQMPAGEIGGPDSEVFYQFDKEHDPAFGKTCHPNCDCGRFLEIGNSVFIQYRKNSERKLEEMKQKSVDYGGGLDRILAAVNNEPDVFKTDLFAEIITTTESVTGKKYKSKYDKADMRIIVDHLKGAAMMLAEGVNPSNKKQGYVARRLLRRVAVKLYDLEKITNWDDVAAISEVILETYDGIILDKDEV
ncbi:MAG: alanine--tRNA ligase-related protein, partial [Candidatus Paceibacterota bacterium]